VEPAKKHAIISPDKAKAPTVRILRKGQSITPISGLNMYANRWTIRPKVIAKSHIRTWSNTKGEGYLFSAELLDESGVDVRCTFFKQGINKFYNFLEEGRVYTFSGGNVKVTNMKYNNCKSHFKITFDTKSEIHLDNDKPANNIQEYYDFVKIDTLASIDTTASTATHVDILAVVTEIGEVSLIISKKSGKELMKCELVLEDDPGTDVRLTMWGDAAQAAQTNFASKPVVAFKQVQMTEYGLSGGRFQVNPPQAQALKQWWEPNNAAQSLSMTTGGNQEEEGKC
jgi:replication factor A1